MTGRTVHQLPSSNATTGKDASRLGHLSRAKRGARLGKSMGEFTSSALYPSAFGVSFGRESGGVGGDKVCIKVDLMTTDAKCT